MGYTNFLRDRERGKEVERMIDKYYSDKFDRVEEVPVSEEIETGVDRKFYFDDRMLTVEYKADFLSEQTGNVFVEISVDSNNGTKEGWAKKSQADVIMVYAGAGKNKGLYLINNSDFKMALPYFMADFKLRKGVTSRNGNEEWWSMGLCVPLHYFASFCFKFIPEEQLKGV